MAYEDLDDYSVGTAGSDTFDIVIPDLDPNTAYPIQFRWQFADNTLGLWSVSKVLNTPEVARAESTNIVASWNGTNLEIVWDAPDLSSLFTIYITSGLVTVPFAYSIDKTKTQQKAIISAQELMNNFSSVLPTSISGLLKTVYIDTSTTGSVFSIPAYVDAISGANIADADWSVLAIANGYTVSWGGTLPLSSTYDYTSVYKSSSENGVYEIVYSGSGPAIITVASLSTNYIKIKHFSITSLQSNFSNVKQAIPYDPVTFDDTPPDNDIILGSTPIAELDSDALFQFNYKVPFSWTESSDASVRGYRIRFRVKSSGDPYTYMSVPGKSTVSSQLQGLLAGAIYEIGVTTYDVYGNINATYKSYPDVVVPGVGNFAPGAIISAGDMEMGYGVGGSNSNRGLYLAPVNYWYVQGNQNLSNAARFSVGGATDSMVWDGTDLTLTGTVNANAGNFTGSIQVGNATTSGQFRLNTSSGTKIEMGALTGTNGAYNGSVGIQGTDATGQLFQLDVSNGIIVNRGTIGGWTITSTSISKSNTSLNSDGSITAGSAGQFSVSSAGALVSTNAIITGEVKATSGFLGNTTTGWQINSETITSKAGSTNGIITLNSNTGSISGGLITGTRIVASSFEFTAGVDYLKSDGSFSLGGNKLTYAGSGDIQINGGSLTFTGVNILSGGDDNGYGGDPTVVINNSGQLTRGRAFHYGSTNIPTSANYRRLVWNSKSSVYEYIDFNPGDVWMTVD